MSHSKYLFIITGSISAYKTLDVISELKKQGHSLKVVLTKAATEFVTPLTFAAISAGEVYSDLYDTKDPMSHIELARWADQIIVAPATANFINKIAAGVADDLASNLYLAHDFTKPFIIYPAMNHAMLNHPQTQASLAKLKGFGIDIQATAEGILACGEIGQGKLADVKEIYSYLSSAKTTTKKILITAGGTKEPIDGVRHIGNMSSGKTAKIIAEKLLRSAHQVTFVHASDVSVPKGAKAVSFTSFESLDLALREELANNYDYIIHAAAISDYSVDYLRDESGHKVDTSEKLSSSNNYSIQLKKNPKLISKLKNYSFNKKIKIIGFKLTHTTDQEKRRLAIEKVFKNSGVEFVVHNDLSEISDMKHRFTIYSSKNKSITVETKNELATALGELVRDLEKYNEVRI